METIDIVLPDGLTDLHAVNMARRWSSQVAPLYIVAYADKKNGRVVINVFIPSAEAVKRIANQIKMFKARVFQNGQQLDDSMFTGGTKS